MSAKKDEFKARIRGDLNKFCTEHDCYMCVCRIFKPESRGERRLTRNEYNLWDYVQIDYEGERDKCACGWPTQVYKGRNT